MEEGIEISGCGEAPAPAGGALPAAPAPALDDESACGAGSDSGVETCGRALSSGGGSRSCASSVVSCGSCGSESSSLAGPAPRPRRRVAVPDPPRPLHTSTPRVVPRGPNLATRERARSREKPVPPEKPKPPTPKPRARPPADLPALARESPALRVKQTRTSTARCRPATPSSPTTAFSPRLAISLDSSASRAAIDKYATLPRRRRDPDADEAARRGTSESRTRDAQPTSTRRSVPARTSSVRGASRPRVRIYAEAGSQTALVGADVEAGLAGRPVRTDVFAVERVSRGVQAERRDVELERLEARVARALAEAEEERGRSARAEAEAREERALRLAARDELETNTRRLLELSEAAGAGPGADCLRALDDRLRAAAALAAQQRAEIDTLRDTCQALRTESSANASAARALERRLSEAEAEASELHEFLCAEKLALQEQLGDTERQLAAVTLQRDTRYGECRQLVRLCETRRQEALCLAARARGPAPALRALAATLRDTLHALCAEYDVPSALAMQLADCFNDASCSESGGVTPESGPGARGCGGGSVSADDRSDNCWTECIDSETEPRPDAPHREREGSEGGRSDSQLTGAWSAEELSPVREPDSSLHQLCDAILHRHLSETLPRDNKVVYIEKLVGEIVRVCRVHVHRLSGASLRASRELVNGTKCDSKENLDEQGISQELNGDMTGPRLMDDDSDLIIQERASRTRRDRQPEPLHAPA